MPDQPRFWAFGSFIPSLSDVLTLYPHSPVDQRQNYKIREFHPFLSLSVKYFHMAEYLVFNKPICGKGFSITSSRRINILKE